MPSFIHSLTYSQTSSKAPYGPSLDDLHLHACEVSSHKFMVSSCKKLVLLGGVEGDGQESECGVAGEEGPHDGTANHLVGFVAGT